MTTDTLPIEDDNDLPRRGTGRRGPRASDSRESPRSSGAADGAVMGRNGELLSRRQSVGNVDQFEIPDQYKEKGWSYQWIAETVYNSPDVARKQNLAMQLNGWRPVTADRMPGVFMPQGYSGHIIIEGQGLYERPQQMTDEAMVEDQKRAVQLMRDRDQALMGGKAAARNLAPGMEMSSRYRGTGADVRMQIDKGLDIPMPQHKVAAADE